MNELKNNIKAIIFDCILKGCENWLNEMTSSTFVTRSPCPSCSTSFVTLTSCMITTHVIFTISNTVLTTVHTVPPLATFCYIENLLHICREKVSTHRSFVIKTIYEFNIIYQTCTLSSYVFYNTSQSTQVYT